MCRKIWCDWKSEAFYKIFGEVNKAGPCLVPKKFCKIFQIPRHIESLDTCMKY